MGQWMRSSVKGEGQTAGVQEQSKVAYKGAGFLHWASISLGRADRPAILIPIDEFFTLQTKSQNEPVHPS